MNNLPKKVNIREVGPRDGFQMECEIIPTDIKIGIIDALTDSGLKYIEATSFVSPKALPQMRDAKEVMQKIKRNPYTEYEALVPNERGAKDAIEAGVDRILCVASLTDIHNRANVNMTVNESIAQFAKIVQIAKDSSIPVIGALACGGGCPFSGHVPVERVIEVAQSYVDIGMDVLYLADSAGMSNPVDMYEKISMLKDKWPDKDLIVHIHNTRNAGFAIALAALEAGVDTLDASIGGLGGCPFLPGATGNLATEDLVNMLNGMGIETGVDLDKLIELSRYIEGFMGRKLPGYVKDAGKSTELRPIPEYLKADVKVNQDMLKWK